MHTVASFKVRYSWAAELPDAAIQAHLDEAATEIDSTVWGDHAHKGHGLMAAHTLALSPEGAQARLIPEGAEEGVSVFSAELDRLRRIVGGSYRPILNE